MSIFTSVGEIAFKSPTGFAFASVSVLGEPNPTQAPKLRIASSTPL